MRLGIYADLLYRRDENGLSTDRAFVRFATSLADALEELVILGRLDPQPGREPYNLPHDRVRFVPLPFYPRGDAIGPLLRSIPRSARVFLRELDRVDALWILGPHPLAVVFACLARARGKTLFLGVRQDYPKYIANRLPSSGWRWSVAVAELLERTFRFLGRTAPTVALGEELAANYGAGPAPVLTTGFSLVRAADLVSFEDATSRSWVGELRLLSVGRLDPEKNPLLLVDVLAELEARDRRWRLVVAGNGPLEHTVRQRAVVLGLGDRVSLLGYVPNGSGLWNLYRDSHAFLHVSLTEGLPQVLVEAQAAGLPVVATDVGGVAAALGSSGIVVPPADATAAANALAAIAADEKLRYHLIAAGLENATRQTLEVQRDRLLAFFREHGGDQLAGAGRSTAARATRRSDVT